jgi:hypothetical protein
MRSILVATLILIPSLASAEFIPAGCYVADYYRTDPCWSSYSAFYEWNNYNNSSLTVSYYGGPVATIIQAVQNEQTAKNACLNQRDALINAFGEEQNRANNNYDIAVYYQGEYSKQASYAKKLKKACGTKCKKIKAPK